MKVQFFLTFLAIIVLTGCKGFVDEQSSIHQFVNTRGHQIHYRRTYCSFTDKVQLIVDSTYDVALEGLTEYRYNYMQFGDSIDLNCIYMRDWREEESFSSNYPYEYSSTSRMDSITIYSNKDDRKESRTVVKLTILSKKSLDYTVLATAFQYVYNELCQQIDLCIPHLFTYVQDKDKPSPSVRFNLTLLENNNNIIQYSNNSHRKIDAIWLPQQQILLPLLIEIRQPLRHEYKKQFFCTFPDTLTLSPTIINEFKGF